MLAGEDSQGRNASGYADAFNRVYISPPHNSGNSYENRRILRRENLTIHGPMSDKSKNDDPDKVALTLPGTVEKVIPPFHPSMPEKAEVSVEGADELYREIRVENTLTDQNGNEVSLKPGAQVEVTIEADADATKPKNEPDEKPNK